METTILYHTKIGTAPRQLKQGDSGTKIIFADTDLPSGLKVGEVKEATYTVGKDKRTTNLEIVSAGKDSKGNDTYQAKENKKKTD